MEELVAVSTGTGHTGVGLRFLTMAFRAALLHLPSLLRGGLSDFPVCDALVAIPGIVVVLEASLARANRQASRMENMGTALMREECATVSEM